MEADFSGYATRSNVKCTDGRTILVDAFAHQNGETVPLVWQHGHDDPTNVLGHAVLENVSDGVKCKAYFNKTEKAQHIKEAVRNGDIKYLSIFANQLQERAKQVAHGVIREVSLVIGGANPGAMIDIAAVMHSDGLIETLDEATITSGLEIEVEDAVSHAETKTSTKKNTNNSDSGDDSSDDEADTEDDEGTSDLQKILDTLNEEQMQAVQYLLSQALTVESDDLEHDDMDEESDSQDDGDDEGAESDESNDADSFDEDEAEEDSEDVESDESNDTTDGGSEAADSDSDTDTEAGDSDAVQHDNTTQEENSMTHNVFAQSTQGGTDSTPGYKREYLKHGDMEKIIGATLKGGSLKEALEDYALEHGIENIDFLFPDPKQLTNEPSFISRRVDWVDGVLNAVRKTPFSRIRTTHADITADEARARGYIKGNLKVEEFFELIRRDTTPQTVYKKQKLDRDDVLDITDLDIVAFVKAEMQLMLSEEIAGAILIGDGRSAGDDDKIKEDKIRPIASDSELYTTTIDVNLDDANSSIEELVDKVIATRKHYKGTGTPTFYTDEDTIGAFLTVKDSFGHRLYKNLDEVAQALRVSAVVSVEILSRVPDIVGILVNLAD